MASVGTLERRGGARSASGASTLADRIEPSGSGLGVDAIVTALFGLFGWVVGSARLGDNSFFWHLRTGEHILDHGFPHGDVFSYTAPGTKWVAQSWLAEVTYGALNRTTGAFGIRVFIGAVGVAVSVLAYRLALRLAKSSLRAAGITAVSLAGVFALWSERPLVLGVLFLLVLLWVVEVPECWVGRHALVVVPVLIWLWVNAHGSFALGIAYVGLHVLGRWIDGAPPWEGRERGLVIATSVGVVASLANPYGLSLLTFPIELLSRGEILSQVYEWQSPSFRSRWGIALAVWIAVYVCALAVGRHRVTRRDLVVTVPMLLLALWATRNIAVAPLVGLPVVARAFASDERTAPRFRPSFVAVACAAVAFVGLTLGVAAAGERDFSFDTYPVRSMRYLDSHGLLGERIYTDDADAGYVILEYWPEQKVFMDDRFDMYPVPLMRRYLEVSNGGAAWNRVLGRHDVDVVVWRHDEALASLLDESDAWRRVHRDASHAVWVRRGSAAADLASS